MSQDSSRLAYTVALVSSTVLWTATSALSGRREPWDWGGYWTVSYPIALLLAGVLGSLFPQRPWRWALVVIFSQMIVMLIGGSGLGLLPLGLVLLGVLSLPAIVAAKLGARMRR